MALKTKELQEGLQKDILEVLNTPISEKSKDGDIKKNFAKELSSAIANRLETWIKTAEVTVQPGIAVSTAGTAAAQKGFTTSNGKGKIS